MLSTIEPPVLIVSKLMWEAIETPRPAAWRVIFKGLTLLEHLVKSGSERCVDDARNHSHLLRNLDKFNYYDGTVDRGVGVREKSKQVVEMLQDDDRIREERQKARKLREKFAGKSQTASSSDAGGGSVGGGGEQYSGYGNTDSNWKSKSPDVRSGDSSNNRGYAGRYGEGGLGSGAPTINSKTSTTASTKKSSKTSSSISGAKAKKTKKNKAAELKKNKAAAAAEVTPAAPVVDLFSFDAPVATAAAVEAADNSFDAFQTAAPPPPVAANADEFRDFDQIASSAAQFDAFGAAPAAPAQQQSFNAFGGGPANLMQQTQSPSAVHMNAMNNTFGNMGIQQNPMSTAAIPVMANSTTAAPPAAAAPVTSTDNDGFGDFEDAKDPFSSPKSPDESNDPLSKLISLDGLSKNTKKEVKSSPDQQQINLGGGGVAGGNFGMAGLGGGSAASGQMQGFQSQPVLGTGQKGEICREIQKVVCFL